MGARDLPTKGLDVITTATKPSTRHARARVDVLPPPPGTGPERPSRAHVGRILRAYDAATAVELAAGESWYADARTVCEGIAADTGLPATIVVAVLAHTSANTGIADNIAMTRRVCEAYRDNPDATLPSVHTADVMGKVDMTLRDYDLSPLDYVTTTRQWRDVPAGTRTANLKVRSFFRCVLGDASYVAVDVWATRVADPGAGDSQPTHARYRAIEAAYRVAARRRGVAPAVMQATVWIVARGKAW